MTKLNELRESLGAPPPLEDDEGKEWAERIKRARDRHKKESGDWPILRAYYARPYATVQTSDGHSVVVKIPWIRAYLDNLAADIYVGNPDPYITSRVATDLSDEKDRILREVAKSEHDDLRTCDKVQRGIIEWGLCGFGGLWFTFEQDARTVQEPVLDGSGQPVLDADDKPTTQDRLVVDDQRIIEEFVGADEYLFDPDGTDWIGLTDFKWIGRIYERTLQEAYGDEESYPDPEARKRLVFFVAGHGRGDQTSLNTSRLEDNIAYLPVKFVELWSLVEKRIVHMPLDAKFTMADKPWPRAFAQASNGRGRYPTRLISDGFAIKTDESDANPYPTPLARHIRALVEDYIRIWERLLNAGNGIVPRYVTFKGLVDPSLFKRYARSDDSDLLVLDPEKFRSTLGVAEDAPAPLLEQMKAAIQLLPSSDTKDQIIAYGAMLDRIERLLWQATGQGPADRGGVAPSATATENVNMTAGLERRTRRASESLADVYDDANEIIFLITQVNRTLPLPFVSMTGPNGTAVMKEFDADMIRGARLSFSHATGSSRPPTRDQVKVERSELFAKIAPFADAIRYDPSIRELVAFVVAPYDPPQKLLDALLSNPLPPLAEEWLRINLAIKNGQIPPEQLPAASAREKELASMMVSNILTPNDKSRIAMSDAPNASTPASGGPGNVSSARSAGQQRAAMASAAMPGGAS